MDLRRADLHTHTCFSDGKLTPTQLVQKAVEFGIKALAVTDHDTLGGLHEARAEGEKSDIEIVSGVELSVHVGETEVHMLGYFFDHEDAALTEFLDAYRGRRIDRGIKMVERLNALGLPLDFEAVEREAGDGVIGRPHIARAMEAAGLVEHYGDAFQLYLADKGPACVAKHEFPAAEALQLLHEAGGIGVLAHPGHWTADADLMYLIRVGLDGIESLHPAHDEMLVRYYRQVARDFLLIETGGSDYHGFREQDELNFGHYSVPFDLLELARQRASTRLVIA